MGIIYGMLHVSVADILTNNLVFVTFRFFDDIRLLRQRWQSSNTESVAELLVLIH